MRSFPYNYKSRVERTILVCDLLLYPINVSTKITNRRDSTILDLNIPAINDKMLKVTSRIRLW